MSQMTKQVVPFTQVSNEFLNDSSISLRAKGLFSFMFSKPDNWNFTIKSMASQLKEGERAIITAMNELKERGYVSYIKFKDGSGEYVLNIAPVQQNPNVENDKMLKSLPISKKEPLVIKIDSNMSDTPRVDQVETPPDPIAETFEEWWLGYDKKVGKKKTNAVWCKMTDEQRSECLSVVGEYVLSTPNPTFRPNPVTYLNGELWNDEIIFKSNGGQMSQQANFKNKNVDGSTRYSSDHNANVSETLQDGYRTPTFAEIMNGVTEPVKINEEV